MIGGVWQVRREHGIRARATRIADLHAKRRREPAAERALVAGADHRARFVDRIADAGEEGELRHIIDEDAVVRQRGADRVGECRLRLQLVHDIHRLALSCLQLRLA